jgi:type I toxin-antitoxin system toxin SymE
MTRKTTARRRPPHQTVCWIPRDERQVASRARTSDRASIVPSIALSGEWLRRAGFPPGARILIMVQCAGQLIIDRMR